MNKIKKNIRKMLSEELKEVNSKADTDTTVVEKLINEFYPYAEGNLAYNKPVMVDLVSDASNSQNPLGKTAYYDPNEMKITLYVDGRHPKDILRSFSHELVHHTQNCRGEFDNTGEVGEGYAQNNEHLRKMEKEAYLEGNLLLRDWEDGLKQHLQEIKKMNVDEGTLREIIRGGIANFLEGKKKKTAPKHDCAKHVKENATGREGVVVSHNWNETLQEVTKYDVKFGEELVENIPVSELTILEMVSEGHHGMHEVTDIEETVEETIEEEAVEEGDELDERKKSGKPARRGVTDPIPEDRVKPLEESDEITEEKDPCEELKAMDAEGYGPEDSMMGAMWSKQAAACDEHRKGLKENNTVDSYFQEKNKRLNEELIRRWTKK